MRIYTFSTILLSVLAISSAYADLASTQYVQSGDTAVEQRVGTYAENQWNVTTTAKGTITGAINELNTNIGDVGNTDVATQLGTKQNANLGTNNSAVITDNSGNITTGSVTGGMIDSATITNSNVASNAGIKIGKLNLPSPTNCSGSCGLIYNAATGTYTWENMGRGSDTAPTGGVTAN